MTLLPTLGAPFTLYWLFHLRLELVNYLTPLMRPPGQLVKLGHESHDMNSRRVDGRIANKPIVTSALLPNKCLALKICKNKREIRERREWGMNENQPQQWESHSSVNSAQGKVYIMDWENQLIFYTSQSMLSEWIRGTGCEKVTWKMKFMIRVSSAISVLSEIHVARRSNLSPAENV